METTFLQIVTRDGGNIELYLDTTDFDGRVTYGSAPSLDTWHCFVMSYDGTTGILELDGTEIINDSQWGGSLTSSTENWTVSARSSTQWELDSLIGHLHIWSDALTATERQAFYDVVNTEGTLTTDKRNY